MKKNLRIFLGIVIFVVLLALIGSITGLLQVYKMPTPTNEPAIKQGEIIFVSSSGNPAPYKFAVITSQYHDSVMTSFDENYKQHSKYIYRICGVPGDILEMKGGILFVNNKNFDELLNLKRQFIISKKDVTLFDAADISIDDTYQFIQIGDSVIITLDDLLYKKYASLTKLTPYLNNDTSTSGDSFDWFDKNSKWNMDNFGPLIIPPNKYFLLGDNRHNAMDSRFCGFVKKENITGFVINK